MVRPSYKTVDRFEKEAYIASRNDVLVKSFVTDLWLKVISRAIDDLVIYQLYRAEGKELKEEEKEYESSAYNFLFNDEYTIPLDDYNVLVSCCRCEHQTLKLISLVVSEDFVCPECKAKVSSKTALMNVLEKQCRVEITLKELLSYLNLNDIDSFRDGCKKRIKDLVGKRKRSK